jgi:hypothetical protein
MIKKFNKYINESIRDKMTPKSEEEIIKNLNDENKLIYDILNLCKEYWKNKGIEFGKEYKTEKFASEFKDGDAFFRMYMTTDGTIIPTNVTIELGKDERVYVILIGDVKYNNGTFMADRNILKNRLDFKNFML